MRFQKGRIEKLNCSFQTFCLRFELGRFEHALRWDRAVEFDHSMVRQISKDKSFFDQIFLNLNFIAPKHRTKAVYFLALVLFG